MRPQLDAAVRPQLVVAAAVVVGATVDATVVAVVEQQHWSASPPLLESAAYGQHCSVLRPGQAERQAVAVAVAALASVYCCSAVRLTNSAARPC